MTITIDTAGHPMMSSNEVEIMNRLIEKRKPRFCLEWGSGGSTIYFPREHQCIEMWLSIEHNGHYQDFLKDKLEEKARVLWLSEKVSYIDCVKKDIGRYDMILIDGKWRDECLKVAHHIARKDTLIILHDSGREAYKDMIAEYDTEKLIDGEVLQNGYFAHRGLTLFKK